MKSFFYHFINEDQKNFPAKVLKGLLWVLSLCYVGTARIIFWLYQNNLLRKNHLPRPVISIGNLTVGGTGKTPLTGFLAAHLKEKGLEPVILIRGYMAENGISDEVELYREILPEVRIVQGRNRFASGTKALSGHCPIDAFILDDGFQHWSIDRDLEIVVIDTTNPFGNGFCLPRGILREPLSALKRADIIVLTKTDLAQEGLRQIYTTVKKNNYHAIIVESIYEPTKLVNLKNRMQDKEISEIKVLPVVLFSAIGNPQAFEKTVGTLGVNVQGAVSFLDHHVYTKEDVHGIIERAQAQNIKTLITTQKDAVKLKDLLVLVPQDVDIFALAVSFKIVKGEKEFEERIHIALSR